MLFLIVDFHSHTSASKDSLTSPERLIASARRRGLDRVVVTDHNTIAGARAAHALAPELVIVGEEIMTTRGEILAAFVTEEIPAGLSPLEAIRLLRGQGAFVSVSHPFDAWRSGAWDLDDLLEIVPLVDAIEVFNARCMMPGANRRAAEFARQHNLPGTAGSDAHAAFELGRAVVWLPQFDGPDGLRSAIRQGTVRGRQSPLWIHFTSRYASLRKKFRV
ncbi:MAG: phosphotransferase domain-containing protein [Anaerolineaceae bacterium]|nr:MAG: phosphotransferase domain-containing protein [Anaerolineaceae bacterium]